MNLFLAGRRIIVSAAVVALLFVAVPAQAQQMQGSMPPAQEEADMSAPLPYHWNVSFGAGTASGANPVGSVTDEEQEMIFTFDIDHGALVNVRAARRVWWRLGGEVEFGHASPGVTVTETDLDGQNVHTSPFGDYSMSYGAVSLRLDLVDARITPFLLGGVAVVVSSVDGDSGTNPGFLFGGGLDVHIVKNFYLRGDVRGLRSNVDAGLLSGGILTPTEPSSALSTQVLWTLGVSARF